MAVSYMLQFLDKISITQSAIMGIRPELVCTSLFFFFFFFQGYDTFDHEIIIGCLRTLQLMS